jgi:hypothetical protein
MRRRLSERSTGPRSRSPRRRRNPLRDVVVAQEALETRAELGKPVSTPAEAALWTHR